MIWVGCQLRFFSHVGDGAVLGNIASIFFTKHRTLYEYRKNEQTTKSGRRGRRPLQSWIYSILQAQANNVRPYISFGQVPSAAKSLRSLRIYITLRARKAVQI